MRTTGRTIAAAGLGALLCGLLTTARPAAAQLPETRVNAVRLVDRVVEGRPVTCLFGNVFIDRDSLTAAADTATSTATATNTTCSATCA